MKSCADNEFEHSPPDPWKRRVDNDLERMEPRTFRSGRHYLLSTKLDAIIHSISSLVLLSVLPEDFYNPSGAVDQPERLHRKTTIK